MEKHNILLRQKRRNGNNKKNSKKKLSYIKNNKIQQLWENRKTNQ